MFVPLPVPFVLPRTASDLHAWRLKSPLALRSHTGKLPSHRLRDHLLSWFHPIPVSTVRTKSYPSHPRFNSDFLHAIQVCAFKTHPSCFPELYSRFFQASASVRLLLSPVPLPPSPPNSTRGELGIFMPTYRSCGDRFRGRRIEGREERIRAAKIAVLLNRKEHLCCFCVLCLLHTFGCVVVIDSTRVID